MEAVELAPDLWRWTGYRDTIGTDVGSVYYKTGSDVVLIDPLLPPEDPDEFWRALDRDVASDDRVLVLLTSRSHTRSAYVMAGRYPGGRVWSERGGSELPGGMTAHPVGRRHELAFWIPAHRALVLGDVVAGDGDGGLRLGANVALTDVGDALRELAALPVELVLPSHGGIVRGADALRALLA